MEGTARDRDTLYGKYTEGTARGGNRQADVTCV